MFIHWGLYSVPAREWKGQPVPGLGEWIMNRARIPVAEYEQLATQFNPVKFNADEWVAVAKNAGAKYIAITSKHHDGFAMYGSKISRYNIVDATPFHRDPMKELADACQRAGIKLCFYYSQAQDWHEPDGNGNTWDWPDESKKNFSKYLEEKVKPQVRELLTNYGPIGLIWFDTPKTITKQQSAELVNLVHELQPMCLVSGRVGHGLGDYDSAGDNQISVGVVKRDWETPVTMNDTWGFKKDDHNWKSTAILIRQLVQIASRGGNYLLNVGPTSEGVIPQPSVERLAEVGQWLKVNSEAINGTAPSPYPYELSGGLITARPGKMYLHVFEWPRKELVLYGLDAYLAEIHKAPAGSHVQLDSRGVAEQWFNKDEWMSWDFKTSRRGAFDVVLLTSGQKYGKGWEGGHHVAIDVAGQNVKASVENNGTQENPMNPYWKYVVSKMGRVQLDKPGKFTLSLRPESIESEKKLGLTLVAVKLVPAP